MPMFLHWSNCSLRCSRSKVILPLIAQNNSADSSCCWHNQRIGPALLVARSNDGVAVGMASAQLVISTAEGAPSAWIEDVVVQQALRGQGIARLLLEGLLDWAQRHGATRAQLLADNANTSALDFYRHIGWQPTQLSAWRRSLHDR